MSKTAIAAVYNPGAVIGLKLRRYCKCPCHNERHGVMHFVQCCELVKGFKDFPELDEHNRPVNKLPNCPNCGVDELGAIHSEEVLCYACNWRLLRNNSVGVTT